ncbi:MAG: TerB family tellurite resistance protein [Rhodospirillales bacterium]|nr:TerB family tellurite resistance protein [Alphaproteobacteria bacterium]MCB1838917.1 TerB family tellurite resistance protein [Alphaproteobacteria bacterium]MCB9976098.1 TerB family tellurite resistance protein [Rhodospirillales bacterium]
MNKKTVSINESQFYMWRTLFAIAHADNILADGEIQYMAKVLEEVRFTFEQTETLKDDIKHPKDIEEMFAGISDVQDRILFFDLARELVWADGDFGEEEQSAIIKLKRAHFLKTDVDELIGKINLEFEDDRDSRPENEEYHYHSKHQRFRKTIFSFRDRFLETITGRYS